MVGVIVNTTIDGADRAQAAVAGVVEFLAGLFQPLSPMAPPKWVYRCKIECQWCGKEAVSIG